MLHECEGDEELIALTHLFKKKKMLILFFWTRSPLGIYTWTTADLCVHAMAMTHSFAINTLKIPRF